MSAVRSMTLLMLCENEVGVLNRIQVYIQSGVKLGY